MIYVTGDTHGEFQRLKAFGPKQEDTVIILGDVGLNIYRDEVDLRRKRELSALGCTFFCVRGNHEMRPSAVETYRITEYLGGKVYCEPAFPNLLFPLDGEIFTFGGYDCLVLGGAYSIDKYQRLHSGMKWFADEQPTPAEKRAVAARLAARDFRVDVVLSHTCPAGYIPVKCPRLTVENYTENWLQELEFHLDYKKWYCGHFHFDGQEDRLRFMFKDIEELRI